MSEIHKLKTKKARQQELHGRQQGDRQRLITGNRVKTKRRLTVPEPAQMAQQPQVEQGNPVMEEQEHVQAHPAMDLAPDGGAIGAAAPMANEHAAGGDAPQEVAPQALVFVAPGVPINPPADAVPAGPAEHEAATPTPAPPTVGSAETLVNLLIARLQSGVQPAAHAAGAAPSQHRANLDANEELRVMRSLKLEEYNGREEKGKLQTWKFRLTRTFERYQVKPEWQIGIAVDLLKGVAEQWYMRLVEDGTAPTSVTQLYEMLHQRFVPQAAEDEARGKLHALTCKSESQISDYIQKFEALTAVIPTSDLADRKWRFRWGLCKFPDLYVTLNKAPDIGAAIQAARDYEQARKDSQRHVDGQSRPHSKHITSHREGGDQPRQFQSFKDKQKPKWQAGHGQRWQDRRQHQQQRFQGKHKESNGHQFQKGRGRPQGQPQGQRRDFKPKWNGKGNRDGRKPDGQANGQSQA